MNLELWGIKIDSDGTWLDKDGVTWVPDLETFLMCKVLDFCGCGNPEPVLRGVRRVIVEFGIEQDVDKETAQDADLIYLYVADKAGLMEHGGSVYGAWSTAKGDAFVKAVDELYPTTPEEAP